MKLPKSFTKVTPFSKWLALSMLVVIPVAAFFYGQYYERTKNALQSANRSTNEPLVSIIRHGGLCPDGECTSETFIYKDGSIVEDSKIIKQLPAQQVKQLENRFITTNFNMIRTFPFTETCPTAYDGQESIYTFYLPDRQETFASCEYDLSESFIFEFIDTLISPDGTFCSGKEDIQCQPGYMCSFEGGTYLDPGGTCTKVTSRSQAKEGEFCGGIAAFQCQEGYICQYDGTYPDAGGKCVKTEEGAPKEEQVFCTMEAKQCPDGSFVGRKGPSCEFSACPGE